MSTDNGIYILQTKGKDGKKEHRVVEAQCIEDIFDEPDYPCHDPVLNMQSVHHLFGDCKVFNDRDSALTHALQIAEGCMILEYGISSIDTLSCVEFPKSTVEERV